MKNQKQIDFYNEGDEALERQRIESNKRKRQTAKCEDCLNCVMMSGPRTIFFCEIDEDISLSKLHEFHECRSYDKDK